MNLISAILLSFTLIFNFTPIYAETDSSLVELDQLADEALQMTKFHRYEEAKRLLEQFSELFSKHGVHDKTFSMDELRVLTVTHHEAMKAVTSIDLDGDERIRHVTTFRLAMDAVVSTYQPLWAEMESPILEAFKQVKNAALEGDHQTYEKNLNAFLSTYTMIQPSLKIDVPVERLQKLDAKITYIDQYRKDIDHKEWSMQLDELEDDLKKLFTNVDKDEADPSIWWVIMMTGSIIVLTLSYVSWRKYKGEKQQKKQRKDTNN